jgi:hypothetical protein
MLLHLAADPREVKACQWAPFFPSREDAAPFNTDGVPQPYVETFCALLDKQLAFESSGVQPEFGPNTRMRLARGFLFMAHHWQLFGSSDGKVRTLKAFEARQSCQEYAFEEGIGVLYRQNQAEEVEAADNFWKQSAGQAKKVMLAINPSVPAPVPANVHDGEMSAVVWLLGRILYVLQACGFQHPLDTKDICLLTGTVFSCDMKGRHDRMSADKIDFDLVEVHVHVPRSDSSSSTAAGAGADPAVDQTARKLQIKVSMQKGTTTLTYNVPPGYGQPLAVFLESCKAQQLPMIAPSDWCRAWLPAWPGFQHLRQAALSGLLCPEDLAGVTMHDAKMRGGLFKKATWNFLVKPKAFATACNCNQAPFRACVVDVNALLTLPRERGKCKARKVQLRLECASVGCSARMDAKKQHYLLPECVPSDALWFLKVSSPERRRKLQGCTLEVTTAKRH